MNLEVHVIWLRVAIQILHFATTLTSCSIRGFIYIKMICTIHSKGSIQQLHLFSF